MKKTWYRVTLDVAYEGEITDREGKVVTDPARAKEILGRVVKSDLDVALRRGPAGPVDWDVVDAERRHNASCMHGDCWCKPGSDGT